MNRRLVLPNGRAAGYSNLFSIVPICNSKYGGCGNLKSDGDYYSPCWDANLPATASVIVFFCDECFKGFESWYCIAYKKIK